MQLKDYYKLLELPPSASVDEIRKAYRRLAHQYHPDKNGDDLYALTRFAAIKEAYETLINPVRKEQYLQQRWYAKSTGRYETQEIITPVTILQQLLALERYTAQADVHRMDQLHLQYQLDSIFTNEAIDVLNSFDDRAVNEKIIQLSLSCCRFLPHRLHTPILKKLERIQASAGSSTHIQHFSRSRLRAEEWEKKQYLFVIMAVLLVCALIYFFST